MTEAELLTIEQDREQIQEARRIILGYYDLFNKWAELAYGTKDHISIYAILSDLMHFEWMIKESALECDEWVAYRSLVRVHRQTVKLKDGIQYALVQGIIG